MNQNIKRHPSAQALGSRAVAAKILATLLKEKQPLDLLITEMAGRFTDPKEKAFTQELCYGVCRWYYRLDFLLGQLLDKALRSKDLDIKALLLCGLYQLEYLRTPAHAAVSASVEATISLNKPWAKSLINAVLRRYQREFDALQVLTKESAVAQYAHPDWLITQLKHDWPQHYAAILNANNERPPMHLRVNRLHTGRDPYLLKLNSAGFPGEASGIAADGIWLYEPVGVEALPGFKAGDVSVQDFGAQLAAPLLDLQPGQRVLDACAAPGGKTGHIFALEPKLKELIAIEHDKRRVELLHETQRRLQIEARILHADARQPATWWDGHQFDRILLDAPCSATGVIRRHPDIKILRTGTTTQFATTQSELLESVWPLLKQGGKLVYATCSLLNIENDNQIGKFTARHPDAKREEIDAGWGVGTEFGRQTLPGHDQTDGFYYAILTKI